MTGTVPQCFKTAVVKPLLKKKTMDPSDCKSYRPVSNLPYLSKLLERVVSKQLVEHLTNFQLLDDFQSAYRPGHSCETAVLRVLNDVLCSADKGDVTLLVLLDLSAAFDLIDHQLLLSRLQHEVGMTDTVLAWFRSYLCNRKQHVTVNSSSSTETILTCGVPQGSVLGPVLFSLYTTQLGKIIEDHGLSRKLFADDSEIYKSFPPTPSATTEAVTEVEECCRVIKSWMLSNRLKLNDSKTEAMLCGAENNLSKVDLSSIKVGTANITLSDVVRDLGFLIDRKLSLVDYVNSVVKSTNFSLRSLGQLRPHLNEETARAVAVALIQSKLDYCNSCLYGLPKSQINRLQKIQNKAARIVTRTKKFEHISPILRDLHWLPVEKRIDHKVLSLAYSCIQGSAPRYLSDIVPKAVSGRNLRSDSQLLLRRPALEGHKKKTLGARSFESAAPNLWNALPQKLRDSESKFTFKKHLKTYLF